MADDALDWLDAALLLRDAAAVLWLSLDSVNRKRLLLFMESEGRRLVRLAEDLGDSNE